jgi:hypothetical protein
MEEHNVDGTRRPKSRKPGGSPTRWDYETTARDKGLQNINLVIFG